ncbi:protein quaking-B-like isoform X1 [Hydra vulgaris]|uniref:Protein quaking-B-like isoform X1 n=1 Tax=Hydra vulgaris TaxID=6087 RepID=A0ABM4BVH1_HYDVU
MWPINIPNMNLPLMNSRLLQGNKDCIFDERLINNLEEWLRNNAGYSLNNGVTTGLSTCNKRAKIITSTSPNPQSLSAQKMVHDELSASEYLNQLLQDKTTVSKMPKIFLHSERLLDEEINRVRNDIFCPSNFLMSLPKPQGNIVKLTEKVYAKVKEYPKFNFVGRIIGPRGLTLRQVEQETACKLLVRGRGSMKDKKAEDEKRGLPNYEHLDEDLHVLIMVEDTEERAHLKLQKTVEEVNFLLTPPRDGEDDIKKKQLQDLAILNGTYRAPINEIKNQFNGYNSTTSSTVQNGLLTFPSPTPVMNHNNTPFPALRSTSVTSALKGVYSIDSSYMQRSPPSFLDFVNLDSVSLLAGKR